MKVLAVAGIGAGSVLLASLGVWTISARRRDGGRARNGDRDRDRASTAAL